MRRRFVAISKACFNWLYRHQCRKHPRENMVLFLSRKAEDPSYDFRTLAAAFEARGWRTRMHLQNIDKKHLLRYCMHVLREIKLLARCRVAILDRYDPIISLMDFECEAHPELNRADTAHLHTDFPSTPTVIQLWHAFGAYKKFGYQSIGTREGHTREVTDVFNIHRNYTWVICSGEGCRDAFAEAFCYPRERILPLNRPEYDELLALGKQARRADRVRATYDRQMTQERSRILFAPTLRKSRASAHPFRALYEQRASFETTIDGYITWSFHPLEDNLPAPGNVSAQLLSTNLVVTDYSSIVYEAYLLRKPVLFYIPDIASYLVSPGLNSDPTSICPELCISSPEMLSARINELVAAPESYPWEAFDRFAAGAFDADPDDPLETIAHLALGAWSDETDTSSATPRPSYRRKQRA